MKFGPFLLTEIVLLNVDLNLCTHLGARCRCTEFILVLEIEEFRLPKFALKVLQALKVWAKMRKVGKSAKPLRQDSNP